MTRESHELATIAEDSNVVIVGAGPAGLTAAYEVVRRGLRPLVLEALPSVGGIARTELYRGHRFDIGGHRFYTKVPEVQALWEKMLGDEFLVVPRLSRIFSRGRFFNYPLEFFNALGQTGVVESGRIVLSYLRARLRPHREASTFEEWVVDRFGKRLYETFFKSYTEKVWGMPCSSIRAEWAAQRIRNLSLHRAVADAMFGNHRSDSLIREFHYPVRGPGMMWQRFREEIEAGGGRVVLGSRIARFNGGPDRVRSLTVEQDGRSCELPCRQVISTMPIGDLVRSLDPPAPDAVIDAASALRYRALLVVGLIVRRPELFPDNWIYVHDPGVRVGRIQNFRNWSAQMCAGDGTTNLGLEYFCDEGDDTWSMADEDLVELARRELAELGLASRDEVVDGVVFRQANAYPVYSAGYRESLETIREYLETVPNLHTVGRNGLHRYNNQDHSMVTALRVVGNLCGEEHDVWSVNTERSYSEENRTW